MSVTPTLAYRQRQIPEAARQSDRDMSFRFSEETLSQNAQNQTKQNEGRKIEENIQYTCLTSTYICIQSHALIHTHIPPTYLTTHNHIYTN